MAREADKAVAVKDVSVQFGTHEALCDIDFTVEPGRFVAIVGPNGSGKTTLLKTLQGLVAPDRGTVRVMGAAPEEVDPEAVGHVPQVKTLDRTFPAQAIELVLSALHRRWPFRIGSDERAKALEALERVHADHLAERALGALSGGELQRIYLARSLIRQPKLVMLDEPATGVDVVGALDLYDLLEDYQADRGATILMVTHDWNAAYHHADQVLVLDGQQVSFGPPDEALSEAHLRQAFGHVGHAHAMLMGGDAHA